MPNLVGIGLSQVPTNSMLGGLAYQSPDHASIKDLDLKNLSQINSEIADTARDIFIYDTSKDSDGGAWRKRTSHTSWYNETLNTSVRGSRREFPAVAVIVGNSGNITIYDGDDPNLPMWMVFNTNESAYDTNYMIWGTYNVVMKNGWLYSGSPSGESWENVITRVNFISERSDLLTASGIWYGKKSIADRNTANLPGATNASYDTQALHINSNGVNDIVATVLPNAPVDSTTGLPTPTFAIATNAGITVFTDDGKTFDSGDTLNWNFVDISETKGRKVLNYGFSSGATVRHKYLDTTRSDWGANAGHVDYEDYPNGTVSVTAANDVYASQTRGIAIYDRWNIPGSINANYDDLVSFATTSYNTGWMHGDIKGAFLSDTDTTNAGSNLVINGTFDSTSNWTLSGTGAFSISSGTLNGNGTAGVSLAQQAVSPAVVEQGKTYTVRVTVTHTSGNLYARVANSSYSSNIGSTATHSISLTAGSVPTETVLFYSDGWSGTIDNVEVILEDQDRSVNNNGLQVFGTITKSAVATGAELVAYSGWSSSNYLEQPYNSDLNFGTGDFCVMGWVKTTSTQTTIIMSKSPPSSITSPYFEFQMGSGSVTWVHTSSGGALSFGSINSGTWRQLVYVRSSGIGYGYKDGVLIGSHTNNGNYDHSNTDTLRFGYRQDSYSGSFDGSLALFRISGSAPSPEQIKKIYEDEKHLFQENAKATLYGSSDAVTALAYDEVTQRLHVGTSSGRSDFKGLRRINNTTTAVTTAISSHDEFIVEQ